MKLILKLISNDKMYFYLILVSILIVLNSSIGEQPADKDANAKTKQILDYIIRLAKKGKFLSGQFGGWSKIDFSLAQINEIKKFNRSYSIYSWM